MRQGIHSAGGGDARRHGKRQQGVFDGFLRDVQRAMDNEFDFPLRIRNHRTPAHFRSRAGGRGNGNQGGFWLFDLSPPLIILESAPIRSQNGNPLGRIQATPPAQGNDHVATFFFINLQPFLDLLGRGLGHDSVIHHCAHTCPGKVLRDFFDDSRGTQNPVGHDENFLGIVTLGDFSRLFRDSQSEMHSPGKTNLVAFEEIHLLYPFAVHWLAVILQKTNLDTRCRILDS